MTTEGIHEIQSVYYRLVEAWNNQDARGMAELFLEEGELIGFDGSQEIGPKKIFEHVHPIFENHPTARFVCKVKDVRVLSLNVGILRAIAGMVPRGQSDINPQVNTHHTLVVVNQNEKWRIQLFQNTPAQFHGRPELVEQMTEELREQLKSIRDA
ncbi:SgcJ/EcaC family oxidoreductase [Brevibacillus ginsengisoli]|uniref:SgcJ/EcaC family oxidoreductase n=1 Tax=Brevibacillus ginsengisoli TaxID=363854 RepID=UPI003CF93026